MTTRQRRALGLLAGAAILLVILGCKTTPNGAPAPTCATMQNAVRLSWLIGPDATKVAEAALLERFPTGCAIPEKPAPPEQPPVTTPPSTTPEQPPVTTPPGTLPPTPPPPAAGPQLLVDELLSLQQPQDGRVLTWRYTKAAIERWRKAHPEAWKGDATSVPACLAAGPAGIDAAYFEISKELAAAHIVGAQSIDRTGKRSDAIFVNRPGTKLCEETHAFEYGRACVATGEAAVLGVYVLDGPVTPIYPGPPTPPPLGQWGINCHAGRPGATVCDATPQVLGLDYCTSVGFVNRNFCPVRPECDVSSGLCIYPDRAAWERVLVGGDPVWTWTGDPGQFEFKGPYTVGVSSDAPGVLTVCNVPRTVCKVAPR